MPPAAILDIDGTLVDTNSHHAVAWYRAFRQHEIVLPIWRIHTHMGMGGDQLVGSLCGRRTEEESGDGWEESEASRFGRYALRLWGSLLEREQVRHK